MAIEVKNEDRKEVKKVVQGKALVKRQPAYKRLLGALAQEDGATLKNYILLDVVIPAIKRGAEDAFHAFLYGIGGRGGYNNSGAYSRSNVSYRNYYEDRAASKPRSVTGYNYDEIILSSRMDAERVLQGMDDIIESYGIVSVSDYYELADVESRYTDNHYGWNDIRNARIARVGNGYTIRLPKAMPI